MPRPLSSPAPTVPLKAPPRNDDTPPMSTADFSTEPSTPFGAGLRVTGRQGSGSGEVRHAVRDGHTLVTFRSTPTDAVTTVECEVRNAADPLAPARTLGPYTFTSPAEARSFGDELMLALEYLGCELVEDGR